MEKICCSRCNKCMTDENGTSFVGVSLSVLITNGDEEFVKAQWGKYYQGPNTKLNFCWECLIASLMRYW